MADEPFGSRLAHAWNAFLGRDPTPAYSKNYYGASSTISPNRTRVYSLNDRSIVNAIYNRIAMDVASMKIEHVRTDENGIFQEEIDSYLNYCLTQEANLDQTSVAFIQDVAMRMFNEGVVAIVPVDTTLNPKITGAFDIKTMRAGTIIEWYPKHVKVKLYNENTGKKEEIVLPKTMVAIIENPMYSVMNEPNGTLQRLLRVLKNVDVTNDNAVSGKMDLIIQLPYNVRSPARREQAEERRKQIEAQLVGSKYGIAYADSSEKITQLNRPIENQLWQQAKDLKEMVYEQLGLSAEIFNGTANEEVMLNYYTRTINPILQAITDEMSRKFLSKTARTQHQTIWYARDQFALVPVEKLADLSNAFSRNEILTANEIRAMIGYKPSTDPRADELRNSNMPSDENGDYYPEDEYELEELEENQNGEEV